jgi:D-tyrosyl-tRNA(Tyr) deacylase
MRAVVQRVCEASVCVEGQTLGTIGIGFVVLLGIGREDGEPEARYLSSKIAHMRVFDDGEGKMNLTLADVGGSILLVSQFTLYGDARKGRRPGFVDAAPPQEAERLVQRFGELLREHGIAVEEGKFQAHMQVRLNNDGPVTMLLDTAMMMR